MIHNEPKCPYCGGTMILEVCHRRGLSYACPACWSESPFVKYEDGGHMGALCLEAAMRRPIQKPLTLEELKALIDAGKEAVTYCEAHGDNNTYANIWIGNSVIDIIGVYQVENISFESYGKTWRAWASRPTDEERAAAQWEE